MRKNLPVLSVFGRFLLATFLVFATYNPSGYSVLTWALSAPIGVWTRFFTLICLGIAWVILVRLATQGLGRFGGFLLFMAVVAASIIEFRFQFLGKMTPTVIMIIFELFVALTLTFGLVYPYFMRQITGQSAVVKTPP